MTDATAHRFGHSVSTLLWVAVAGLTTLTYFNAWLVPPGPVA